MSIIARAKERRSVRWQVGLNPGDPALVELFGGSDSPSGINVTPTTAMQQSTVLACVRFLSEIMASLPLFVNVRKPDGEKAQDPTHRLYPVLHERPNRWQTSFEWRDYMMHSLLLRGFAISEIFPADDGYPYGELVPLHPDKVLPFRAPDGSRAYRYTPATGPARTILQDEALFVPFLPGDGYNAVSVIRHAAEVIGMGLLAQRSSSRLFAKNLRPGGLLKLAKPLSKEAKNELRASWEDRHSGPNNAGRLAILEEGMEFSAIAISPADAQLMEQLKMTREDLAQVFGVKPHKVGILDRATFSNIEHEGISSVVDTFRPHCVRWEQAMLRDLFTPEGRRTHFAEFELDGLLRGDIKARFDAYAIGKQWGWLNTNTILRKENMNTIGPEGDIYLMPMNMTVMAADGMSLTQRLNSLIALKRAGFDAPAAAAAVGLPVIEEGEPAGPPLPPPPPPSPEQQRAMRAALPGVRIGRERIERSYEALMLDAATRLVRRDLGEIRKAANKERSAGERAAWLRSFEPDERAAASRMLGPVVRSLMEAIAWDALADAGTTAEPDMEAFAARYIEEMAGAIARNAVQEIQASELPALLESWKSTRASAIAARELTQASEAATNFVLPRADAA